MRSSLRNQSEPGLQPLRTLTRTLCGFSCVGIAVIWPPPQLRSPIRWLIIVPCAAMMLATWWTGPESNTLRASLNRLTTSYNGCMCSDCAEHYLLFPLVRRWQGCGMSGRGRAEEQLMLPAAAIGTLALLIPPLRRRSSASGECPACGYRTTGLPSPTCPECGGTVTSQRDS